MSELRLGLTQVSEQNTLLLGSVPSPSFLNWKDGVRQDEKGAVSLTVSLQSKKNWKFPSFAWNAWNACSHYTVLIITHQK